MPRQDRPQAKLAPAPTALRSDLPSACSHRCSHDAGGRSICCMPFRGAHRQPPHPSRVSALPQERESNRAAVGGRMEGRRLSTARTNRRSRRCEAAHPLRVYVNAAAAREVDRSAARGFMALIASPPHPSRASALPQDREKAVALPRGPHAGVRVQRRHGFKSPPSIAQNAF